MGSVAIFKGKLVKFLAKAGILIPKRLQSDRSLTPDQGETAFNTTTNKLEVYDGTSWQSLSQTGTLVHPNSSSTVEYGENTTFTSPGNTLYGVDAGNSLTGGGGNTFIGTSAGNNSANGMLNVAVGYECLITNTSGNSNVAIGQQTLYANNIASSNVGVGSYALQQFDSDTLPPFGNGFNVGVGQAALQNLTAGNNNTGIGPSAGTALQKGVYNTFVNTAGGLGNSLIVSGTVAIGKDNAGTNAVVTANNDFVLGTSLHNYKLPGTIVTDTKISVNSSSNALRITQTGTGNALVVEDSASTDTTPFVITNSGKVLMGSTTLPSLSGDLTIVGSNGLSPSIVLNRNSNDAFSTYLRFDKTRAGAKVENGDRIGNIEFSGDDGFDTLRNVADIDVFVDGSTAAGFPGRIVFSTSPINGFSAIERMRIDSAGVVTFTGSLKFNNALTTTTSASTIASATTIAPTAYITFVSGTTAIATITAPSTMTGGGGQIVLIPTGAWTTNTTGNIALATTAVVNRALTLTYDSTTTKWYPSY
jgi:hypothetical protein